MSKSAYLKIERAKKHVAEANELLAKKRPFAYCVETDNKAHERATFAKKNVPVIDELALICGDAVHCLRSAIDHAYWEIVSPHVENGELKRVQFPFCERQESLNETMTSRMVDAAPPQVRTKIENLKPYRGGNEFLYLLHEFDLIDKHKLLIPSSDYSKIDGRLLRRQVPDFPLGLNLTLGNNRRDVVWNIPHAAPGEPERSEKELDVPVEIVFKIRFPEYPVIPTLHRLVRETTAAVDQLYS